MIDPPDLARMSLNQITVDQLSLADAVAGCERCGISWIAPWRHKIEEVGVEVAAHMLRESGLKVSSLCRGGFFPGADHERRKRLDDNRRAVGPRSSARTCWFSCAGVRRTATWPAPEGWCMRV
jgi:sugar phosphate isomerase/epimerase